MSTSLARLAALRAELARQGLDGFLVPRADEHLGQYVPPAAERLAWISGFTGSAGLAVVLADRAALFVDGRYTLQAGAETERALWELHHLIEEPPGPWLARAAGEGARIGYDPWLFAPQSLEQLACTGRFRLVALEANPLDAVWEDRPPPPASPAVAHDLAYAGETSSAKRAVIAASLRAAGEDALIVSDPASLCWLLNIRGADLPFTPVALGFLILHANATADLFMDPAKLSAEVLTWLGNSVHVAPREGLGAALKRLTGRRVRVDPANTSAWFVERLRAAGASVAAEPDPCLLAKARKNPTEQEGTRSAHRRDALALCRFLHWLENRLPARTETELSAAARLLALRREGERFCGESFPAISAAGEHGAIIHYRVRPETDRPLCAGEPYLIDSGGQYQDGTTDVTRTWWLGPDAPPASFCEHATRVLKGHIAIATLTFPQGTTGLAIDAFARRALWEAGLDFDHGTGHGVGSYLSVHEGPAAISRTARPVALAAGMILSNEPGFYLAGRYGIRHENLVLVGPSALGPSERPFLCFETLTLAPFDRRLILPALLSAEERAWLTSYHARVQALIGPLLPPGTQPWLAAACAPL